MFDILNSGSFWIGAFAGLLAAFLLLVLAYALERIENSRHTGTTGSYIAPAMPAPAPQPWGHNDHTRSARADLRSAPR
ncbi:MULTISPECIES: hypothetical protein [Luteimonas]|uniref:hypothetical protein n=1 Tax=Luteimonas TaxID=83614 RepID=UPI00117F80D1|nr:MULTISPECIES: hypothetical protein [Luteimonas]